MRLQSGYDALAFHETNFAPNADPQASSSRGTPQGVCHIKVGIPATRFELTDRNTHRFIRVQSARKPMRVYSQPRLASPRTVTPPPPIGNTYET